MDDALALLKELMSQYDVRTHYCTEEQRERYRKLMEHESEETRG